MIRYFTTGFSTNVGAEGGVGFDLIIVNFVLIRGVMFNIIEGFIIILK